MVKEAYNSFTIFCVTDLDPCINVSCKYFAVCKAFGPREARCICVDNCPSYEEPVCSSNGTTYDNVCVFQREMCHLRANFTVYHPGDCTGKKVLTFKNSWEKMKNSGLNGTRSHDRCDDAMLYQLRYLAI